jgi:hypothetical protein
MKRSVKEHRVSRVEIIKQAAGSMFRTGKWDEFWEWEEAMRDIGWLKIPHSEVEWLLSEAGCKIQIHAEVDRMKEEADKIPFCN